MSEYATRSGVSPRQQDLLDEIVEFLSEHPMSETTFGRKAVNDGKFVPRLRNGRRCWPETADKAREYIARKKGEGSSKPNATEAA